MIRELSFIFLGLLGGSVSVFAADTPSSGVTPMSTPGMGGAFPRPAVPQSTSLVPSASIVPASPNVPIAPASPSAPSVPVTPVYTSAPAPNSVVDYKKFRDPFKEPVISEAQEYRSDLERYPVTDFKVVAIITGPLRMRAMLVAPDAKTHYVSEKMKIGVRDGVIVKITTKTIVVREKVVNPLGEVELFDTEIGLDQPTSSATATQ